MVRKVLSYAAVWLAVLAIVVGLTHEWTGVEAQTTGGLGFLDSAARTSTTTGERVTFTQARGLVLTLNVTAASGTTPTLNVKIQHQDPVSLTWNDLSGAAFQQITAAGSRTLTIYPAPEGAGVLRSITGTDPAAGAEVSETVPANARWKVRSFRVLLAADATVATRLPFLLLDDGTTAFGAGMPINGSVASTNIFHTFANYGAGGSPGSGGYMQPLPDLTLQGGYRLRTSTTGIVAGDNYGAPQYLVEELQGNYAATPVPRFLRAVATIAGTTPSFTFSVAGAAVQ